jgi:hypothetical protein
MEIFKLMGGRRRCPEGNRHANKERVCCQMAMATLIDVSTHPKEESSPRPSDEFSSTKSKRKNLINHQRVDEREQHSIEFFFIQ